MKNIYFSSLSPFLFIPNVYGSLRAYCEQFDEIKNNYEWKDSFFLLDHPKNLLTKVENPDVFCASCYIKNFQIQMDFCKVVKNKYPNCLVVVGGPQIPSNKTDFIFKYPFVDIFVHGEGEIPLKKVLIENLNKNPNWVNINGITFRNKEDFVTTGPAEILENQLDYPSSITAGYLDFAIDLFKSRGLDYIWTWETNRGCPFQCIYCNWGCATGTKIRTVNMERVKSEIDYFGKKQVDEIYLCDANFSFLDRDLEIIEYLVKTKEKTGYPKRIKAHFSVKSNKTIFEISRLLQDADMFSEGTSVPLQSSSHKTQCVIKRFDNLKDHNRIKNYFSLNNIPTYSEVILGLPEETKDSFIAGICKLMEMGYHTDLRPYECVILPNTPLADENFRKKFNMRCISVPLLTTKISDYKQSIMADVVIETSTLTLEDWKYCSSFAEFICCLHYGGYTKFLSIFLNSQDLMLYSDFYQNLFEYFLRSTSPVGIALKRIQKLLDDYVSKRDIPQTPKINSQSGMLDELKKYNYAKYVVSPYRYLWLIISNHFEDFYSEMSAFLERKSMSLKDDKIIDALRFQKDIMLRPEYNPKVGKICKYNFNWRDFYFRNKNLQRQKFTVKYSDTHMGINSTPIISDDYPSFARAALGTRYRFSKLKLYYHQYETSSIV